MTDNYKFIQEDINTGKGTEGTLLIPRKIYDVLWPAVVKKLIPRECAAFVAGPAQIPGSSFDFNLMTPDSMSVRPVGEGAEVWLSDPEFTATNTKPAKFGLRVNITKEMVEDSQFPLLARALEMAGREFSENENSLVVAALDGAANTVSGGAAVTIANLTRAMQYLEDSDFTATHLIVGIEVLNDLRNIDTFVEYNKIGNTDMLTRGFLGNIYGMQVLEVSTNAGMTTTSAYVIDKEHAYFIAEKRPVTMESYAVPWADSQGVVLTHRIAVNTIRTSAIAKITST